MQSRHSSQLFAALCLFSLAVTPALADNEPAMVFRSEWKAKPPRFEMQAQIPKRILIHHTGSKGRPNSSIEKKMLNLQHFSQSAQKLADGRTKPPWADVPYHFYLSTSGVIAQGREIMAVGDTNTSYDPTGFIQIVLEGNFDAEVPTAMQLTALERLMRWLVDRYGINASDIKYHDEVAQTVCPGKNLISKLPAIVEALGQSSILNRGRNPSTF